MDPSLWAVDTWQAAETEGVKALYVLVHNKQFAKYMFLNILQIPVPAVVANRLKIYFQVSMNLE